MRTLTITLDHLPPADLNPNRMRSIHWSKRSAVERTAREEAYWLALDKWRKAVPIATARVSVAFTFKDGRERDLDNLLSACKPYLDGLKDAGVISGDSYKHLKYGGIEGKQTGNDQTKIIIEEVI
jgi:hypothetical protein